MPKYIHIEATPEQATEIKKITNKMTFMGYLSFDTDMYIIQIDTREQEMLLYLSYSDLII